MDLCVQDLPGCTSAAYDGLTIMQKIAISSALATLDSEHIQWDAPDISISEDPHESVVLPYPMGRTQYFSSPPGDSRSAVLSITSALISGNLCGAQEIPSELAIERAFGHFLQGFFEIRQVEVKA